MKQLFWNLWVIVEYFGGVCWHWPQTGPRYRKSYSTVKINLFLATNISACNKATAKLRTFLETSFYSLLLLFWSLCDQTSYTSCKSWFSAGTFIVKKCAQKSVIFIHLTYSDHLSFKIDMLEKSKIFPRMCVALL